MKVVASIDDITEAAQQTATELWYQGHGTAVETAIGDAFDRFAENLNKLIREQ